MGKISTLLALIFSMTIFCTSVAFAYYEKGEDMSNQPWVVNTLEIKKPDYHPSKLNTDRYKADPKTALPLLTAADIENVALEVARQDKLPFAVVAAPEQGDAYATITIANDSRIAMFVDVYSSKDNTWLYSFQVNNGRNEDDKIDNYKYLFHKFYRAFNLQREAHLKALQKNK